MLCKCSRLPEIMSEKIQVNDKQELRKSIAETGTTAAAVAVPAATSSVIGETSEASAAGPAGGSTREKPAFVLPPLQAPSPGEGEACVVPGAPDCGSGTGAGGCPAADGRGDGEGDTPRFWAGSHTPKASSDVRPSSVDWCCCAILASRCEFTAAGLIAATVKPDPSGSVKASVGGEPAGSSAESIPAGVALSPTEPGDDDLSSTSMPPLGSVLLPSLPNAWCGRDWSGLTACGMVLVVALRSLVRRPSSLFCRGIVIWTQRLVPSRCEW